MPRIGLSTDKLSTLITFFKQRLTRDYVVLVFIKSHSMGHLRGSVD